MTGIFSDVIYVNMHAGDLKSALSAALLTVGGLFAPTTTGKPTPDRCHSCAAGSAFQVSGDAEVLCVLPQAAKCPFSSL